MRTDPVAEISLSGGTEAHAGGAFAQVGHILRGQVRRMHNIGAGTQHAVRQDAVGVQPCGTALVDLGDLLAGVDVRRGAVNAREAATGLSWSAGGAYRNALRRPPA